MIEFKDFKEQYSDNEKKVKQIFLLSSSLFALRAQENGIEDRILPGGFLRIRQQDQGFPKSPRFDVELRDGCGVGQMHIKCVPVDMDKNPSVYLRHFTGNQVANGIQRKQGHRH
uniref:Centrosomal protein of 97 kDa n=1 Tax=Lygus hesperus TaxID=30085 RepID=A0A0A9YJ84_LYGHE